MKIGSKPGRKNICWNQPPLLWFKQLAVVIHQCEGIPIRKEQELHERTMALFPAVTRCLGVRCNFRDVEIACSVRGEGRAYHPHKLSDRVNSGLHYNEAWVQPKCMADIWKAYFAIKPLSRKAV